MGRNVAHEILVELHYNGSNLDGICNTNHHSVVKVSFGFYLLVPCHTSLDSLV
jgi:hypothetical protein